MNRYEALWKFCFCGIQRNPQYREYLRFLKEEERIPRGIHKHYCIFSGYIPDNQLNEEQKKAIKAVQKYQEESQ
jgi:hypothetical protein